MKKELERLVLRKKAILVLLARGYVRRELDAHYKEITKYLIVFAFKTPTNTEIGSPQNFFEGRKEIAWKEYNFLLNELAREAINEYLLTEKVKTKWYYKINSLENIAKKVVERKIKSLRKEREEEWKDYGKIRDVKKVTENLKETKETIGNRLLLESLTANLSPKDKLTLKKYSSTGVMTEEVKKIIEKIRRNGKISEISKEIQGHQRTKTLKTSPLFKESPTEVCDSLNDLSIDWFINILLGKGKSKPNSLKRIEQSFNVNFYSPFYNFNYLNRVAKNLNIRPEKLQRFLEKINFPYIYPFSDVREDGKKLYLIDELKLNEYSSLIKAYFREEKNWRNWRKELNRERDRSRATQFMKRKIARGVVPPYYFDVVPVKEEYLLHLIRRKNQPVELPQGIWRKGDDRFLTHKEIVVLLKEHFSKIK